MGNHLCAQGESFVEHLPHGLETGRAEDQGRTIVWVAEPQLTEQLRANEGLAQPHDVSDVAAVVGVDHRQAAAYCVQLEVGQLLSALRYQIGRADVGVVQFVEGLQIDMVRWSLGDGPGAFQLDGQHLADVLGVLPEGVEPLAQGRHLGVAGDAHVQLGVAAEPGQGQVGRADHRRARLSVVVVPTQVGLGVERAAAVRPHLRQTRSHQVAKQRHRPLGLAGLGQQGDAGGDALHRLASDGLPLATLHHSVGLQLRSQRLRLLKTQGHRFKHRPVGAAHQDSHLVQTGQSCRPRPRTRT